MGEAVSPGIPCALCGFEGDRMAKLGRIPSREGGRMFRCRGVGKAKRAHHRDYALDTAAVTALRAFAHPTGRASTSSLRAQSAAKQSMPQRAETWIASSLRSSQ